MPQDLPLTYDDPHLIENLKKVKTLRSFRENELKQLAAVMKKKRYQPGELVFSAGEIGTAVYIVVDGLFVIEKFGHVTRIFNGNELFGEFALIDERPRAGTAKTKETGSLLLLEKEVLEDPTKLDPKLLAKIYKVFAQLLTSYMREGDSLYNEMEVLLVQDGGCAPGYNPITAYISEFLEKNGHSVFIAAEGFKSIVNNKNTDYRCLVYDRDKYAQFEHIRGVVFSPPLRTARGADFRSERFPAFKQTEVQQQAADNIVMRKIKTVIAIGGNGTFAGINLISKHLPPEIRSFFVPVTIDSDIWGTSCIGEFTGIEHGAEKIRCYMADARTHGRCYIIEMMGALGGYHALHSCLGAGAHLAVLPSSNYDIKRLVNAINPRDETVIVVAEGYKAKQREAEGFSGNAAEYFRNELIKSGLNTRQRVICEAFSRDIRGAEPNNMDITLAQRMARKLAELVSDDSATRMMPAVRAGQEYVIHFDEIRTDNSVESELAKLANRLW